MYVLLNCMPLRNLALAIIYSVQTHLAASQSHSTLLNVICFTGLFNTKPPISLMLAPE